MATTRPGSFSARTTLALPPGCASGLDASKPVTTPPFHLKSLQWMRSGGMPSSAHTGSTYSRKPLETTWMRSALRRTAAMCLRNDGLSLRLRSLTTASTCARRMVSMASRRLRLTSMPIAPLMPSRVMASMASTVRSRCGSSASAMRASSSRPSRATTVLSKSKTSWTGCVSAAMRGIEVPASVHSDGALRCDAGKRGDGRCTAAAMRVVASTRAWRRSRPASGNRPRVHAVKAGLCPTCRIRRQAWTRRHPRRVRRRACRRRRRRPHPCTARPSTAP